jgi:hypothetical protein
MLEPFRMKSRGALRGDTVPQMSAPAAPEPDGDEPMPELGDTEAPSSPSDDITAQFSMLAPEEQKALLEELTAMCSDHEQQASPGADENSAMPA